jgi:benzylsuccinate CoA-transferase BbsF subunit
VLGVETDDLDGALRRWAAVRPARDAASQLQEAGVAASQVMTFADLAEDPHLAARGAFVDVEHPILGRQRVVRAPWRFSSWGNGVRYAGPLMGADNDVVLAALDGLPDIDPGRAAEVFR